MAEPAQQDGTMWQVEVRNVSKTFTIRTGSHETQIKALDGVSFAVRPGEILAVTGPSGCGKTTVLRVIMGLEKSDTGEVLVSGKQVTGCGYDRGMVFQHAELLPWRSARSNVAFGLELKGVPPKQRFEIADRCLELVGLAHAKDLWPHQLSGGMRQRVGIARALAIEPDVLLMDEPFGALDAQTREVLQDELLDIHAKTAKTVVLVTHDLDEAILLADRVVVMRSGRVQEELTVEIPRPRGTLAALRGNAEFGRKRLRLWELLRQAEERERKVA